MENEVHFPTRDKLHTDILEERYGPIHAEVLRHDNVREAKPGVERIREARLADENNILRTYALTFLTYDRGNEEISGIDDQIRNGGMIGKVFRDNGFVVKKNVVDVFILDIPDWMKKDFGTEIGQAKARLTEFYAKKENTAPLVYGIVLEVYSPDFRNPEEGINDIDQAQINPLTGTLQSVGVPADEIWSRLDRAAENDEWVDLAAPYEQAQSMSRPVLETLHQKILKYINEKK